MQTDMAYQRKPIKAARMQNARTLDRDKAEALHNSGMTMPAIAEQLGVHTSTVSRFLNKTKPEREALEAYKKHRADIFADLQSKGIELQHQLLDSLLKDLSSADDVSLALTVHQKINLISVLNAQFGTIFDKERLERGQSTSNHAVIHKMMGIAFDSSHKEPNSHAKSPTPNLGVGLSGSDATSEPGNSALPAGESADAPGNLGGRGDYQGTEACTGPANVEPETKNEE